MSKLKSQSGLSLIEVLIAIGIFLFVVFITWLFIRQSYRVQDFTMDQATAIAEANRGVETMVAEIREALPADTGAYHIDSAAEFEFIFYTDYDRDNAIEKARYFLDGSDFNKGVTEASGQPLQYLPANEDISTISHYVRNEITEPVFSYYDGDYVELTHPTDPLDIKLVHVHLKINTVLERGPNDFHLASDVQIRNLKDNL